MAKSSAAALCCRLLVELAFLVAGIVVLASDGDNECQDKDADVTLKEWLAVLVGTQGVSLFLFPLATLASHPDTDKGKLTRAQGCLSASVLVIGLFSLAWLICGAVFLADNGDCFTSGQPLGVMIFSNLVYIGLAIVNSCLNSAERTR